MASSKDIGRILILLLLVALSTFIMMHNAVTQDSNNNPPTKTHPWPGKATGSPDLNDIHVLFSTDCSPFQGWQSYVVFHSAVKVNQPGSITRIVSGCTPPQESSIRAWHASHVNPALSPNFHLHFTPDFSRADGGGKDYKFFNKPFGVLDFLVASGLASSSPNTVVAVIDPDEFFLRPLLNDFSDPSSLIVSSPKRADVPGHVVKGRPVAQRFGIGAAWTRWDLDFVTGDPGSPAKVRERKSLWGWRGGGRSASFFLILVVLNLTRVSCCVSFLRFFL